MLWILEPDLNLAVFELIVVPGCLYYGGGISGIWH